MLGVLYLPVQIWSPSPSLPALCLWRLIIMEWTNQESWPPDIHLVSVEQAPAAGNNRGVMCMPLVFSVPGYTRTTLNFSHDVLFYSYRSCWVLITIPSPYTFRSCDNNLGSFTITCGFFLSLFLPVQSDPFIK